MKAALSLAAALLQLLALLGAEGPGRTDAAGVVVEGDNYVVTSDDDFIYYVRGQGDDLEHEHDRDHSHEHELEFDGVAVRCRFCGATVAYKEDFIQLHDTSKAISSRREPLFGDSTELFTFVNPSRAEFELAGFKKAVGLESDAFSNQATVFDGYSYRDLRCSSCKRHVGWAFYHDDVKQCMNTQFMDSMAARSQEKLVATAAERQHKAEIVDKALDGECVLAAAGWWTYEICYKKEVRQYHQEPDGTRPSDWSMGKFVSDATEVSTVDTDVPSIYATDVVQQFAGGQHCDENGELRRTKVVYTCCKSRPSAPSVDKIDEPSLCSYLISVCVPELCDDSDANDGNMFAEDEHLALETCKTQFDAEHDDSQLPSTFAAVRWSTVVSEDSSELAWAKRMQFHP